MKLLVITSRFPYPLEKGDKLRVYHQIKQLSKHFELHLFAITESVVSEEDKSELLPYCKTMEIYEMSKTKLSARLLKAAFQNEAFQIAYFKDSDIQRKLEEYAKAQHVDHVYCQLLRTAYLAESFELPKTIDLMDAFSYGMSQRAEGKNAIAKRLFKRESRILKGLEQKASKEFNATTIISHQDAKRLAFDKAPVIVQNGVDLDYFRSNDLDKKYDVAFVGNLGYAPNVEAVHFIAQSLLPYYHKVHDQKLKVSISGARPDRKLQAYQGQMDVQGWMDDIRMAYDQAKLFVAPIFGGMGQQNKILESMAMGVPVIASSEVANGLNAVDKKDLWVADNAKTFAEAIRELLKNEALYEKLKQNGLQFVAENYDWENATKPLIDIIKSAH